MTQFRFGEKAISNLVVVVKEIASSNQHKTESCFMKSYGAICVSLSNLVAFRDL